MRTVNMEEFLRLPAGTLYFQLESDRFHGHFGIKTKSHYKEGWKYINLAALRKSQGASNNTLFSEKSMIDVWDIYLREVSFLIYEKAEIEWLHLFIGRVLEGDKWKWDEVDSEEGEAE